MAKSRYSRSVVLREGRQLGTARYNEIIRNAIKSGKLTYTELVIKGYERLDTLSGEIYGNGQYWWILAAASDIGWALQVSPGTIIKIPNLEKTLELVG